MQDSRKSLFQSIKEQTEKLEGTNNWLGLVILDIKDFKTINKAYGYECGDALLQHLISELKSISKRPDFAFKLGNDEFALLLPNLNGPNLISIAANKISNALHKPFVWNEQQILINLNIGSSATNLNTDSELLMLVTEHSLAEAKRLNLSFHLADIKTEIFNHTDLVLFNDFKKALYENELMLYYQPKMALKGRHTINAEALLRWNHPTRGMIPPDKFLPICDRLGLNLELTQWVLNTALRHQHNWPLEETSAVAINISADIVDSPELPAIISNSLAIWGTDPSQLTIEITESAIIGDKESGFNNLNKVRELGVKISIDDFGTGYSSLAYFKHIPADEIKIDRSFVHSMTNDNADKRIVELIISLAKSFNLKIVAEGIETGEQLEILKKLNCDLVQGFYLSKPIPYLDYVEWNRELITPPL